jgi:hypothetical protein
METVMTRHQSFHGAFRAELRFSWLSPLSMNRRSRELTPRRCGCGGQPKSIL